MLKNVLTMKSSLGITHPTNLCTIAEIPVYIPSVIFLLLIVLACLTFAYSLCPKKSSTPNSWW